jgi:hypothetical protein
MAYLYSVIAEYRGGTYIKQLKARSAKDAVQQLIKQLDTSIPKNLAAALRRISAETLEPVLIEGCENA